MSTLVERVKEYARLNPLTEKHCKMNCEPGGYDKEDFEDYDESDNDNYETEGE